MMQTKNKRLALTGLLLAMLAAVLCAALAVLPAAYAREDNVGAFSDAADSRSAVSANISYVGGKYDEAHIGAKIAARYDAEPDAAAVIGTTSSSVKTWADLVVQQFSQGGFISYNPIYDAAYYVPQPYRSAWEANYQNLGLVRSEVLRNKTVKVNGVEQTFEELMIFSNGYVYKDGENYTAVTGTVYVDAENDIKAAAAPQFPANFLPGEFNAPYGSAFQLGDRIYQNYNRGYAWISTDGTEMGKVGSKNYLPEGREVLCGTYFLTDLVGWINDESVAGVQAIVEAAGRTYDGAHISALFKSRASALFDAGFNVGLMGSFTYARDGVICQNFRYGDSTFNANDFDKNLVCLAYNPADDAVYLMTDYTYAVWANGPSQFGAPLSDMRENVTLKVGEEFRTYPRAQLFEKGFTCFDGENWVSVMDAASEVKEVDTSYFPAVCGELREKTGSGFAVDGVIYQNFKRGYMAFRGDPDSQADRENRALYEVVGSLNVAYDGSKTIAEKVFYDTDAWDYFLIGLYKDDQADSTPAVRSMLASLGLPSDDAALSAVSAAFKQKYISLYSEQGYNAGMPRTFVKTWGNLICQEFAFGDGKDYNSADGGFSRYSVLMYNPWDGEVYCVSDLCLMNPWRENNNWSALGHPVADSVTDQTVTLADGTQKTFDKLAIFQTGFTYQEGESYGAERGVKYDFATGAFSQVPQVSGYPGEFGTATTSYLIDGVFYQNFQRGYVRMTADGRQDFIGLRNVAADGTVYHVADAWAVDLAGMINRDSSLPANNEASPILIESVLNGSMSLDDLTQMFQDKVRALLANDYSVGVIGSFVKVWNGYIVQDFQSGDGNFSWNNGSNYVTRINGIRCRMSTLVYNPETNELYLLTGDALKLFAFNGQRLGAPTSDPFSDTLYINPYRADRVDLQIFEHGFVWFFDGREVCTTVYGGTYDRESKKYVIDSAAPYVPSEYGELISSFGGEGVFYTNYRYGAIKTVVEDNGTMTKDLYYTGRNFDEDGTLSDLLPEAKTYYLNLIDNIITNSAPNPPQGYGTKEEYNEKLKARYAALWDSGYCAGILDGRGAVTWVNAWTSQFYYGDSTAELGYGDNRTQLSVFILNLDAQGNPYFALIDGEMLNNYTWVSHTGGSNFEIYGKPLADAVTEENGDIHQLFEKGTAVLVKGDRWLYSFVEDGTYQDYLDQLEALKVPSHGKDENKGYIGDEYTETQGGCASGSAAAVVTLLGLACAAVIKRGIMR